MTPPNSADGAVLSPGPAQSETWSGVFVDLLSPDPATIYVEDIARGLSLTCRYGGQIRRFYSVAEHAVLVHDLVAHLDPSRADLLGALFHDAPEAYLHDVTSPAKWAMRQEAAQLVRHGAALNPYDTLTRRMEHAIAAALELDVAWFDSDKVKLADMWALRIEAALLTRSGGAHWNWPGTLPNHGRLPRDIDWANGLDPEIAEARWLNLVDSYGEQVAP